MPRADLWGPLTGLLTDPSIAPTLTDLIVGPHGAVWVDCANHSGMHRYHQLELCEDDCRALAVHLIRASSGRLDDAHPWADAILPLDDDTLVRIHAILSPLAHNGTTLSLRILRSTTHSLAELVSNGMMTEEQCTSLLRDLHNHRTILISGATGVGKTTLLGALVSALPTYERIICVEDTAELNLPHPQLVQLVTRQNNTEGIGGISMSTLVRQALRMRPDRIIVGEVRGDEVVDLLTALNTGHHGSLASLHANSAAEVPSRLLALALNAGMPEAAAHVSITSTLDVIVHLARDAHTGHRYVSQLWRREEETTYG